MLWHCFGIGPCFCKLASVWTQHRSIVNVRRLEGIGEDVSDDDPEGIEEVSEVPN